MTTITWELIDDWRTVATGTEIIHRWSTQQVCRYLDEEIRPKLSLWADRDVCDKLRSAVIGVREADVERFADLLDLSITIHTPVQEPVGPDKEADQPCMP